MKRIVLLWFVMYFSVLTDAQYSSSPFIKSNNVIDVTWKRVTLDGIGLLAINSIGTIIGGSYDILLSDDNGDNWEDIYLPNDDHGLRSIAILPEDTIYITTFKGKLYRSIDNGFNWNQLFKYSTNVEFQCVAVNSKGTVFAGTITGLIYLSDDDTKMNPTGWDYEVVKLAFDKDDVLYMLSELSTDEWQPMTKFYRSADDGNNWIDIGEEVSIGSYYSITFGLHGEIYFGSGYSDGGVFKSTDRGDNWIRTKYRYDSGSDSTVTTLICDQEGAVYIGTEGKGVYMMNGSGESVTSIGLIIPDWQPHISTLIFTPDGHLLAGTTTGTYKTEQVISSIAKNTFAVNHNLENYPNPFCDKTLIRYTVSVVSHVNIEIIDGNGRLIKNLVDLERLPGTYSVQWDAEAVSPGIYNLVMSNGNDVTAKKMLLIKDK